MTESTIPVPGPVDRRERLAVSRRTPHRTRADQVALGAAERARVPRKAHAAFEPAPDRPDPVAILEAQAATRVPELVPVRHGRMMASPFAFYRGAAAIMAADLAPAPRTGLRVQLCGDAHLSNFGIYRSPERALVFDVNDFDETLPGPFEWDVKRLAASFVVAGRSLGWTRGLAHRALVYAMASYRMRLIELARGGTLPTWYAHITVDDIKAILTPARRKALDASLESGAGRRNSLGALSKLTSVVDGRRQIVDNPPLVLRVLDEVTDETLRVTYAAYRRSLPAERRQLIDRYRIVDLARKVVGVGSVGTTCLVAYLEGVDEADPLFLQVKEAQASVLEPYLGRAAQRHHGQRVVEGQRLMQAVSDVFLGWATGPAGRHFYYRQLWDGKWSAELELFREPGILAYAKVCGWALARAHGRSGSAVALAAYLGSGGKFDQAMLDFAEAYADQNDRDYAAARAAVASGRIEAVEGL
jgi:uncharacterized protein (DUF2252 family)